MGLRRRSTQATPPARRVAPSMMQGVELDAAVAGEEAAASGVEGVVVFEHGDGGFDGVDGGGSALEQGIAGLEGVGDALLVGLEHVVGDGPGSAVDEKNGAAWHTYRVQGEGGRVQSSGGALVIAGMSSGHVQGAQDYGLSSQSSSRREL